MLTAANSELDTLRKSHPELTIYENEHSFTESATFADKMRHTEEFNFQTPWHFINLPYLSEPGTKLAEFNTQMEKVNIVDAMTHLTAFLKGEPVDDDSIYLRRLSERFPDSQQD